MSQLLPVESLAAASAPASPGVELGLPNPIAGKALFLRLPLEEGWNYAIDRASLRAHRHLILGAQMWVTRGEARFVALRAGGARFEVRVKVRPWKPSVRTQPAARPRATKPEDERRSSRSRWEVLWPWKAKVPVQRFEIRCHHTERRIEIRWSLGGHDGPGAELHRLLAACQCH